MDTDNDGVCNDGAVKVMMITARIHPTQIKPIMMVMEMVTSVMQMMITTAVLMI